MNIKSFNQLCSVQVLAPVRGTAGEVSTVDSWKEIERMWLGRPQFNGRALPTGDREAAEREVVFIGWKRSCVVPGVRIVNLTDGEIVYTVERVDPHSNEDGMIVYAKVVK